MVITVNDEKKEIKEQTVISELLTHLSIMEPKGLAIAINNRVIKRDDWNSHVIHENDVVILIKATKGG